MTHKDLADLVNIILSKPPEPTMVKPHYIVPAYVSPRNIHFSMPQQTPTKNLAFPLTVLKILSFQTIL